MHTIALIYGSTEGHTRKVAEHIAAVLEEGGHARVDLFSGKDLGPSFDLAPYGGIIVGASIHIGKHQSYIIDFARKHKDALTKKPSAFFSVSLTSAEDNVENQQTANRFVEEFIDASGWEPAIVALFAGALAYTHYGFLKRTFMRHLNKKQGSADLDTSRDYVYTDWDDVDAFAHTFLRILSPYVASIEERQRPMPPQ